MINYPKFKTIQDVFTNNFDALRRWRGLACFPERLPDAVRVFISQQLCDPEVVTGLFVGQPTDKYPYALGFPDKSVLVLPDDLF